MLSDILKLLSSLESFLLSEIIDLLLISYDLLLGGEESRFF